MLATTTLKTLPKFELAVILIYLMMLANVLRPSTTALFEYQQALFQKDDVRRLLGDVDRGVHRNSDICILEGCCVIDAISEIANSVSVPLECADNARLLDGRHFREDRGRFGLLLQLDVGQFFNVLAAHRVLDGQTHLLANLPGNDLIITGDNLDCYGVLAQRRDGLTCRFLGRIKKRNVPGQYQIFFILDSVGPIFRRHPSIGDGQSAQAVMV
jgi:hypothetical protein